MPPSNVIAISGAREHNLKDVSLTLPRDALVVITGLSGSGKSSLAFDTIYAEGQRRYVESLSAYARQFLGQMDKPDVDAIEGLSPAISIDQKTTSRNPRSTVGTVTEIYDYLRLLWSRVGKPHCFNCGAPIAGQSAEQIIDQVMELEEGERFMVLAPVVRGRKGEYGKLFDELRAEGFARVKVDGELRMLERREPIELDKKFKHDISVVVDRLVMRHDLRKRLADSIETAVALADGIVEVELVPRGTRPPGRVLTFSERFACLKCGTSMPELEPRIFSFNNPHGACPRCTGLGHQMEIDPDLVVPDASLSLGEGALAPWANSASEYYSQVTEGIAEKHGIDLDAPWSELAPEHRDLFLHGARRRPRRGLLPQPLRAQAQLRDAVRGDHPEPRAPLPRDGQRRGAREDRGVHVARAVPGLQGRAAAARVAVACSWAAWPSTSSPRCRCGGRSSGSTRSSSPRPSATSRGSSSARSASGCGFLQDVGIGYLTLERAAATLSGGEAQRIRLATQIGSALVGVMYVLDEPSIGLHQRDNTKLIGTLERLRELGNTVLVVEHDEQTMRAADHLVDLGPGAGEHGGHVIAQGTAEEVMAVPELADRAVPGRDADRAGAEAAARRRAGTSTSRGAKQHNLRGTRRARAARGADLRDRRVGLGEVDARQRGAVQGGGQQAAPRAPAARVAHRGPGARPARQDHPGRPVADRAHAAVEPRDLHRALRRHPRPLLQDAGGAGARLQARALLVQRQGRPLRGLPRRRPDQDRDALPARTSTCRASSATASGTTRRRWTSASRASRSPTCSRCRSRRRWSSSSTSRRSSGAW